MNHLEFLKQLKNIKADEAYVRRSRSTILGDAPKTTTFPRPWRIFVESMQSASALALVGLLLVLVGGGFSTWKFLSPFHVSSLDPAGLHAEAQAIDIQIHLTDVDYNERTAESTPATAAQANASARHAKTVKQLAEHLGVEVGATNNVTSSEAVVTIDDVLDELTK